jgi:hypothetical protein
MIKTPAINYTLQKDNKKREPPKLGGPRQATFTGLVASLLPSISLWDTLAKRSSFNLHKPYQTNAIKSGKAAKDKANNEAKQHKGKKKGKQGNKRNRRNDAGSNNIDTHCSCGSASYAHIEVGGRHTLGAALVSTHC